MKPALIETPVFMTFFVRHETFRRVFDVVRQARPAILFLASDGPRSSFKGDIEMIERCRKIAENIDWECKVYRLYADSNLGLLNNTFNGLKFAFSKVDRLIFLEDDILPSLSFFPYCSELLEKYKDDFRVHMICGMNHLGIYKQPNSDYFFSQSGSIWGFAIWKRTFEQLDQQLNFLADKYALKLLKENIGNERFIPTLKTAKKEYLKFKEKGNSCIDFELLGGITMCLNNSSLIIPKKNMIHCLGISANAAHNVNNPKKLPKITRGLFNMKTYEISFPLKHPKYFARDREYELAVKRIMGRNSFVRFIRRIESIIRRIIYS